MTECLFYCNLLLDFYLKPNIKIVPLKHTLIMKDSCNLLYEYLDDNDWSRQNRKYTISTSLLVYYSQSYKVVSWFLES